MNAAEMQAFRKRQGWTQGQLAERLNAALDRKYTDTEVGRWEREKRPVPGPVSGFLDTLALEMAYPLPQEPPLEGELLDSLPSSVEGGPEDSAPPPPPAAGSDPPAGQPPLPGHGGTYARVCEELWELVATGVGMVGAVTGSEALRRDGEIIHADKQALGQAWGKLAETNSTFRRMLVGMQTSGAWLEVSMVTGITVGKLYRSHQALAEERKQEALQPVEEGPSGDLLGFEQASAA